MYGELVVRLGVAALAGALLGAEREWGRHNAGFRTHLLVALGACLFTVLGAYGFPDLRTGAPVDPTRVAAQVASGIGFVGAGAILRDGVSVRGLTTAATLWVSAALGAAAGAGIYEAVLVTLIIAVTALLALRSLRGWRPGRLLSRRSLLIVIEYAPGHGTLGPLTRGLWECGAAVRSLTIDDRESMTIGGAKHVRTVELRVRPASRRSLAALLDTIRQRPEVHAVTADGLR